MKRQAVLFPEPNQVEVIEEDLPEPQPGQLLVKTCCSAISSGTELLFYRGQAPAGLAVDDSIASLAGEVQYPLRYGYCTVGRVVEAGPEADPMWLDRAVFSFHPHESAFWANPAELISVPEGVALESAVFLPNMETAVNFLMDGQPMAGEQVLVIGQGVVGLLTTALLSRYPLARLVTVDRYERRRAMAIAMGADASLAPESAHSHREIVSALQTGGQYPGADLVYELSGAPEALNKAIACAGFHSRVVIGSWYGQKSAPVELGGRFHRSRIRLISSQVTTLTPELSGRWTKERRFDWAWRMIAAVQPDRLITHRFPVAHAAQAYHLLSTQPDQALQVVFGYEGE